MPNMSYCRFQNTLGDLHDCERALDEGALHNPDRHGDGLSVEEERAAKALIRVCIRIAHRYGPEVE